MLGRLRRRATLGLAIGLTAVSLVVPTIIAPAPAFAESGAQNDPAWDFGRGGAEVPGQPACYMPAGSETMRKEYSLNRPACFPGKLQ
jgi:hypothetical protein